MALIITNHDLSTGKTESVAQGAKDNVRLSLITTGCSGQETTIVKIKVKGENGDFYYAKTSNDGNAAIIIKGNGTEGDSFIALKAADFKVELIPSFGSTGTASVDIY